MKTQRPPNSHRSAPPTLAQHDTYGIQARPMKVVLPGQRCHARAFQAALAMQRLPLARRRFHARWPLPGCAALPPAVVQASDQALVHAVPRCRTSSNGSPPVCACLNLPRPPQSFCFPCRHGAASPTRSGPRPAPNRFSLFMQQILF
jgi:hypothetical protein